MVDSTEQIVAEVKASVEGIKTLKEQLDKDVKAFGEKAENGETVAKDALKAANDAATEIANLSARIVEAEQKLADNVQRGTASVNTLGQMVVATDAFKSYAAGNSPKMRVEAETIIGHNVQANTITGQEGSPPANSDTLVPAYRRPGIVPGAFRALRIRDLLPSIQISSNMYEFTRELLWENNAEETAEADVKPESVLTFELAQAPVVTIAHIIKATKQILDDATALAGYIDIRMADGVENRIDYQLINGTGVSQHLGGLLKSGNYTAFSPASNDSAIDTINTVKYLIFAGDYAPTAVLMNPITWGQIERQKDAEDRYIIGNPSGVIGPNLWGLPVVVSNNFPAGKVHISAIEQLAMVANRMGTVVEMFEQDSDNVQRNMITIRAEARLALAVEKPAVARYGNIVTTP